MPRAKQEKKCKKKSQNITVRHIYFDMTPKTLKILRLEIGLYSVAEVSRLLLVEPGRIHAGIRAGFLPRPSHPMPNGGPRRYYDKQDIDTLSSILFEQHRRSPNKLLSIRNMASILGVCYATLQERIRRGIVPAPQHRFKLRRYYLESDVPAVQYAYETAQARQHRTIYDRIRDAGCYTGRDAARTLQMPYITFQDWQYRRIFPRPVRRLEGITLLVYDKYDIEQMEMVKTQRGYQRCPAKSKPRRGRVEC